MYPDFLKYIDYELLGTVGIVFSAENIFNIVFNQVFSGFWLELIGWIAIFGILVFLTAEEALEDELEEKNR